MKGQQQRYGGDDEKKCCWRTLGRKSPMFGPYVWSVATLRLGSGQRTGQAKPKRREKWGEITHWTNWNEKPLFGPYV